jgi:hypothetical protein
MAFTEFDGDLDPPDAGGFVPFDGELDQPVKQPRRGGTATELRNAAGTEAPIPTQADARRAEPAPPDTGRPSALDKPTASSTQDPMLRPEFVQEVRARFANVPEAQRLPALREYAKTNDVNGRAARQILAEVEAENAAVRNTQEQRGALVEIVQRVDNGQRRGKPGPAGPLPFPETNEVMQAAKGETVQDQLARDKAARTTTTMESGIDAIATRAELQQRDFKAEAFAEQNPVIASLGAGAARQWRGAVNVVPTVMDFAARLAGIDTSGVNAESDYSAELKRQADSLMPKVGRQEMGKAWDKGEFGGWLLTNLVAQAPQIAQSVIAAFVPGAAPMALTAMGAQAAGSKFADTRDSAAAVASGMVEAGSEMLPLAAFKRSFEALSKIEPAARGEVLRAIGRALPQVGKAITAQAVTGAVEEVVAEIGNNAIDMARGDNKSLLDGVASAAVIGAVASGGMSLPQAGGALGRVAESGDAQFARALEQDVGNTYFKAQPVADYARGALSPSAYDPNSIDPRIQAEQLAAERAQMPASPAAPAPAGGPGATQGGPQAAGALPAAVVAPRVEAMPDTPLDDQQIAALAAQARTAAAARGVASDVAAAEPKGDAAIGIAKAAPGSLAAASEQVLRANAQAAAAENGGADVGTATAPGDVAARGGAGGVGDAVGSVAGAGSDPGQPGGVRADAVAPVAGDAAAPPARGGTAAQGALNATNQTTRVPERQEGRAVSVAGSDADIRREFSAHYERTRADAVTRSSSLRKQAAGLRQAGTPELKRQASKLEAEAALLEQEANDSPVLSMPPRKLAASFAQVQGALQDAFGRRLVAYYDAREGAADGFADKGVAFVNLANASRSVAFTAVHELQHLVRKEAEANSASAIEATKILDQVWDMIEPAAKRQYAERYLFRNAVGNGTMTVEQALASPVLRDEMLSDFMGKRAVDKAFMRGLAERNPQQFKAFAESWIKVLGKLIDALKGRFVKQRDGDEVLDDGGLKDVDRAITRLEDAKRVAEDVLKAWANSKPGAEQADTAQVSRRESQREGGAPGVIAEVAPNPDKPEAKDWRELGPEQRQYVTKEVVDSVWPQLMRELGWPKATYSFGSGTFEGEVNPNVTVSMPGASFAEVAEMAHLLGYVLDQKAMVAFDESDRTGGSQAGFVKVIPPAGMSTEQVESLRKTIAQAVPQATGDTVRDGAIIYGNFSEYGDNPLSDEQFHEAIRAAVDALPERIEVLLPERYRSEYIEPASRDAYLEGTRYGGGGQEAQAGRDGVRRRGGSDPGRIKALAERTVKRRDDRVNYARAGGTAGSGGVRAVKPEGIRDRPRLSYGEPRADALEVDAWHYSQAPRSSLSTAAFGTGLRGSSTDKFKASADPRLRQRAYFYANKGQGIHPEAGVGGYTHRVLLRNIYDQDSDPLKLLRGMDREAFEAGVLDAGFDGYLYRAHNLSAAVVVLGQKAVPVELAGQYGAIDAGMVVPPASKRSNSLREQADPFDERSRDEKLADKADAAWRSTSIEAMSQSEYEDQDYQDDDVIVADDAFDRHIPVPEARELSAAEMDEIAGDLQAQEEWEGDKPTTVYETPSDDSLASVGIMAEEAYKPLPYDKRNNADIIFEAPWSKGPKQTFSFKLRHFSATGWSANPQEFPNVRPGYARQLTKMGSEQRARDYNKRVAASIDLNRRGFDLAAAIPAAARTRIAKAWKTIADLPGALKFRRYDPLAIKGQPSIQTFNAIAKQMLAGTEWTATAIRQLNRDGTTRMGWYDIEISRPRPDGEIETQKAEIEYRSTDKMATFHAIGLVEGTGTGTILYQIGYAWAHALGIGTVADPDGLTGVNTLRRTEQMMSAMARTGSTAGMGAGYGQRVYGWDRKASTKPEHTTNLVRLALAGARNAAEQVPIVRDMAYNISSDAFTWRRGPQVGQSAEEAVKTALSDPDLRGKLIMSRSALARAAITFAAMDNELKLKSDTVVKSPILYSSRGDSGEYADVGDPLSGDYKQLDGRTVSFNLVIQDSGQQATFTIDAARAMRNLDDRLESARQLAKCIG